MEILSVTNKKTQLHKSPTDLSVICAKEHILNRTVSTDVSFFLSNFSAKSFAQIFKPDILEIWRLKSSKDGVGKILMPPHQLSTHFLSCSQIILIEFVKRRSMESRRFAAAKTKTKLQNTLSVWPLVSSKLSTWARKTNTKSNSSQVSDLNL